MRSKSILWIVLLILTLGLVLITPRLGVSQNSPNSIESIPNSIAQNSPVSEPAINSNMPSMKMSGTNETNFKSSALINTVLIVWFSLTVLSVVYVAWDAFTSNPELTVMKWGWLLVTLYTGVIGATLYILSCKEPEPMQHEEFVSPLWKQTKLWKECNHENPSKYRYEFFCCRFARGYGDETQSYAIATSSCDAVNTISLSIWCFHRRTLRQLYDEC